MIYSRWRPDRGGYDYFESAERKGLGDDMPIPRLIAVNELGAASTDVGRIPPSTSRYVGSGALARGAIMPIRRAGLSGVVQAFSAVPVWLMVTAGITLGWFLGRGSKRK
jgi:hypothetical protein